MPLRAQRPEESSKPNIHYQGADTASSERGETPQFRNAMAAIANAMYGSLNPDRTGHGAGGVGMGGRAPTGAAGAVYQEGVGGNRVGLMAAQGLYTDTSTPDNTSPGYNPGDTNNFDDSVSPSGNPRNPDDQTGNESLMRALAQAVIRGDRAIESINPAWQDTVTEYVTAINPEFFFDMADDLSGDPDLDGTGPTDIEIDSLVSGFQGQMNDMLQKVLESGEDIDVTLHKWLEQKMLGDLGAGIRVNGDGSKDLIWTLPIPLLPPSVGEIPLQDAEGNIVLNTESIKNKAGEIWDSVKSIPENAVNAAKDAVGVLIEAGQDIGGISDAGDILDIAGNIIGSIFTPETEILFDQDVFDIGSIISSTADELEIPFGSTDDLMDIFAEQAASDRIEPDVEPITDPVGMLGNNAIDTSAEDAARSRIEPDAQPIVDPSGMFGEGQQDPAPERIEQDRTTYTDPTNIFGPTRQDAPTRIEPDTQPIVDPKGMSQSEKDARSRIEPDVTPITDPVGMSQAEQDARRRIEPDTQPITDPKGFLNDTETPDEDPPVGTTPDSGSGGGGGGGGGSSDGYMGGLSYQLDAPRSVIYDSRDPMIQLDSIINRSLFKGMI